MDETTKRDLIPSSFDGPSWANRSPAGVAVPGDAPTRPTSSAAAYDPPFAGFEQSRRPTVYPALDTRPLQPGAPGRPPVPFDTPTSKTLSGVISPPAGQADATGMTYASKLPPDHPGLQLDKPKARTLRKGPILTSVGIVSVFVGIALVVALTPKADPAKAASPTTGDSSNKDITLPDSVREAPENNSELRGAPRLGPPAQRTQAAPAASGGDVALRQSMREERAKALASPILVEIENPTIADQAGRLVPRDTLGTPAASAAAFPPDGLAAPGPAAPSGAGMGGIADPNMQQHKSDFLAHDGANSASYLSQPVLAPRNPYEVKAGTVIPTSLITGINSDLPGQIVGQVRENVYDTVTGDHLLIPQGSRLIATYDSSVTFGQERVLVCWNRLIRPDGISIALECMPGVDLAGYAGFADEVDNHWWRIITGVALGTLVSATAQRSQGDVSGFQPTIPQLWAANAGGAVNQAGQAITQKNLAIQPTIKVRPGYSVNVLVTKDIVLVPYKR